MSAERNASERRAVGVMIALTGSVLLFFLALVLLLGYRSYPILRTVPLPQLLLGTDWHPHRGAFGFQPFIAGTLWATLTALLIAVPLAFFTAVYLAEYAAPRVRAVLKPLIDLLAGIPSVVYGVWGVIVVVPLIGDVVAPLWGRASSGYCVLAGGVVLAIMVLPVIIAVAEEVMRAVPHGIREASLALGATRWQTVKYIVVRKAFPGIVAGVMLGFARAFGETMAVLMVIGNVPRAPGSVFDPAYPIPALIANNYGEMMSIPLYDSAMMLAALFLLLVVAGFSSASHAILDGVRRRIA